MKCETCIIGKEKDESCCLRCHAERVMDVLEDEPEKVLETYEVKVASATLIISKNNTLFEGDISHDVLDNIKYPVKGYLTNDEVDIIKSYCDKHNIIHNMCQDLEYGYQDFLFRSKL